MDALAYIRWSTEDQTKGSSERRQTELAHQMCIKHGWTLSEVIIESGKSAFSGANRAEGGKLAAIEKRAAKGQLSGKVLMVENLDRLSRQEPLESLALLQSLTTAGVTLAESSSGQLYTAQSIKENWQNLLVAFIRAGLAYDESYKKSGRIKAAWAESRRRGKTRDGKADGRFAPGWFKIVDGEYVQIPDRVATVRRIFEMSASGIGINRIARQLNGEGSTRWNKGPWTSGNLANMLRSRHVLGEYLPHEKREDGKRHPVGDWTPMYPPIVTKELFHRVQAGLEERKSAGGPSTGFRNVLQGMLHCGVCFGRMTMVSGWRKDDRTQKGLVCSSYHRGQGCKSKRHLHYNPLLNGLLDNVMVLAVPSEESTEAEDNLAIAQVELEQSEMRLDTLVDAFAESGSDAMKRGIERAEADITTRRATIASLKKLTEAKSAKRTPDAVVAQVETLRSKIDDCADTRRTVNALLREVVDGMWFYPEQEEVHVLVAGVHAYRFSKAGVLLGEAVATSAMLEGAHVSNPIGRDRYLQRT
uniref:Putative recombinase family protein n=1 Tax=viral metagenome TaxID=1070528 RepID=A0A6M3XWL2_9ZZZZ